jgi:hypothetical protein
MKTNPDLITIGNIVISVALLAAMVVLLVYGTITFISGGLYFLFLVAALNGIAIPLGLMGKQASQLTDALATSAPVAQVPLVTITHNTPVETQVSSAALPTQAPRQAPQPIILPQSMPGTAGLINSSTMPTQTWQGPPQPVPFQQGTMPVQDWQIQPQPPLSENSVPMAAISRQQGQGQ